MCILCVHSGAFWSDCGSEAEGKGPIVTPVSEVVCVTRFEIEISTRHQAPAERWADLYAEKQAHTTPQCPKIHHNPLLLSKLAQSDQNAYQNAHQNAPAIAGVCVAGT